MQANMIGSFNRMLSVTSGEKQMRTRTFRTRGCPALCTVALAVLLVTVLSACTIRLAPNYEEPIVVNLHAFNTAILVHMAAVSPGTPGGLTPERQKVYDHLKAQGKALMLLIRARPEPKPAFARWFGASITDDIPPDGNVAKVKPLDVPTDDQIARILEQLEAMEKEDRLQGLQPGQYELFANAIASFMRNALTYEMALKR